jgi:hypothetical protein
VDAVVLAADAAASVGAAAEDVEAAAAGGGNMRRRSRVLTLDLTPNPSPKTRGAVFSAPSFPLKKHGYRVDHSPFPRERGLGGEVNKCLKPLFLFLLLLLSLHVSPVEAQDGSGTGDSTNIPVEVVILIGLLVVGFILRGILRRNGAYAEEDEDEDEDDEAEEMLHRHRYHEDEDEELYMLDRDQMWDEDGYPGEDR